MAMRYSSAEIEKIKACYAESTYEIDLAGLAKELGRDKSNLSRKAKELGLTNPRRLTRMEFRHGHRYNSIVWNAKSRTEQHDIISRRRKKSLQEFGHPRGYRELRVCPACGRFFDIEHSNPKKYCSQRCGAKRLRKINMYSRGHGGKRSDLNGLYVRSSYEANYARWLNFLKERKEIKDWQYEPDTFEFTKIKRGGRFYTPDFKLFLNDETVEYHEVKGWDYPKGITKRKRMAKYYPNIKLVVINEEFFKGIRAQGFHHLIPNWE